ncbi:hypothetical protein DL96DRAFT_558275 [Flagelloscypha sp. PMI_526]|nr:hypothetical protein DL96DRAFT_558275 [Flagelloscypha sp. PMI_526]
MAQNSSSITWKLQRGAILILKDRPANPFIHQSRLLRKYIESHHDEWYRFLENDCSDCPEDVVWNSKLLLVTSVHRSTDWSLGAWSRADTEQTLTYSRNTSDPTAIQWSPNPAPGIRDGPSPRNSQHKYRPIHPPPQENIGDQSLFVQGFRISRRSQHHQVPQTGIRVGTGDASSSKSPNQFRGGSGGNCAEGSSTGDLKSTLWEALCYGLKSTGPCF